ncbi:MAG: hypothetical protein KKD83_01880 [Chloroflexi bacterium]|nr:hypothetical protein [Chloroflexota bacterium]
MNNSVDLPLKRQNNVIEGLLLVLILLLAVFMAGIPHLDYIYPLHIDEWWRYGDSQSLVANGHFPYPDPFNSGQVLAEDIEAGYHLLLGVIRLITDISWLNLFRFLPGFIFAMLAFQAYAFGRRRGFGLGAAFLVCLIPTTIRFLGPAFLVPVSLGLAFIPLALFILHRLMNDIRGPVLLFLLLFALLFLHPPTMAVISAIVVIHLVFSLFDKQKVQSRIRKVAIVLSFIMIICTLMFFWAPDSFGFVVKEALDPERHLPLPPIVNALPGYGYIPIVLFIIGVGILFHKHRREDLALITAVLALLAFQQLYPHFYIGLDIIYERGWLYTFVLMALVGGVALPAVWGWIKSGMGKWPRLALVVAFTVLGILLASALMLSLRSHLSGDYYHVIDDEMYQEFLWIGEYVPPSYRIGILDTHEAWPFAAITKKFAYTAEVAPNFHAKGRSAMEFLETGSKDTSWLLKEGITIIYTSEAVENNDLIKVNNRTYLLINKGA